MKGSSYMNKKRKCPYYLLIHTNSYTGNFERELIAYTLGILDEEQKDYAPDFIKAFWTSYAGNGCVSLEDYDNFEKMLDPSYIDGLFDVLNIIENKTIEDIDENEFKKCVEEKKKQRENENYDKDIRRLYDTYLCYTYQSVDDWEQDTFYNIKSFYKNEKHNCDTVFIQLNSQLPEHLEKIIIERIKSFFENDIYNIIKNYEWVCSFGHKRNSNEDYKLLDLELVDNKNNLIKKYV
jgi:hypothetical protein